MKNPPRIRKMGLLFIVLASLGLLFSLTGITAIWIIRPKLKTGLSGFIDIVEVTLKTTDTGIQVLDQSIDGAKSNLNILQDSLDELSSTLGEISTSLDITAALIGDDLQLTVSNTQTALTSAATTAEIIDDTLRFIAAIPILGADYQPEVPLHVSLNQIADGMDDVPATLETLEVGLLDTSESLETFSDDLTELSEEMDDFSSDLGGIQDTLDDYAVIVDRALLKIDSFQTHLPGYLLLGCIFLSGMLLWLGVAQVNVLLQGLALRNDEMKVVNLADLTRE